MKDAKGHGSEPRGGGGTKLTPVAKIPNYAVIIRSIHERGGTQKDALAELDRRGLYLSSDQRVQANIGLAPRDAGATSVSGGQPVSSNAHAAATLAGGPKSAPVDVHPAMATVPAGTGNRVTILHQDGEYAVPSGGKGHYFTNDKQDAEDTARSIHGRGISITHRAKSWGPEMD